MRHGAAGRLCAAALALVSVTACTPPHTYMPSLSQSECGPSVTSVRIWMGASGIPTGLDHLSGVTVRRVPWVDRHDRAWDAMPSNRADGVAWPATVAHDALVVDVSTVPEGEYAVWLEWTGGHSDGYATLTVDRTPPRAVWDTPTPMPDGTYLFTGTIGVEARGGLTVETGGMQPPDQSGDLPSSGPVSYRMRVYQRPQTISVTDLAGNRSTATFDVPPDPAAAQ